MKKLTLLLTAALLFTFYSCDTPDRRDDGDDTTMDADRDTIAGEREGKEVRDLEGQGWSEEKDGIRLYEITEFEKFDKAGLKMTKPEKDAKLQGKNVQYSFEVKDFELGGNTADSDKQGLANSGHGQHIHLIVDNQPYTAHYEPAFTKDLENGEHVILAFLSRSYHMSLKNKDAYVLRKVSVGDGKKMEFDMNGKHLFYSRPKGEYKGENEIKKVLLDFYLHNVDLGENGNKVKATINGTEFTLTKWAPYAIEGLKDGKNTIKLELVDNDGKRIDGPFNNVTRDITLSK